MTPTAVRSPVLISVFMLAGWTLMTAGSWSQQPQPATTPDAARVLSNEEVNDALVQRISKSIEGHEQEPAAQVFKNIQIDRLKKIPASRLLLIMKFGYSHALGVKCTHCHVETNFASDDKRPKRAAREMAAMHFSINQQLAKMENLEASSEGHSINCATCHRGAVTPTER